MRLVSYNIRYSLGKDGRFDLPRVIDSVVGADIIALQEVERGWARTVMADQPALIAELLPGYFRAFGPFLDMHAGANREDGTVCNRRRQFGPMLLSRTPIVSVRLHRFPKLATVAQYNNETGAVEGVIETHAGPLRFYSLHLSHLTSRERVLQLQTLLRVHAQAAIEGGAWCGQADIAGLDWSGGEPPPPMPADAVLMGDFNAEPGGPEYDMLAGPRDDSAGRVAYSDRFVDTWVAAGHEENDGVTWLPTEEKIGERPRRLDYCFVSGRLGRCVRSARVDMRAQGSDHQPYWVELDL